jgi:chromosome segregation ATPase
MNDNFDESSLNEAAINDVETARLALRWALDKIRGLHEDDLKTRQNLQEKASQVTFLENQLKSKNSEIERAGRVHEEEMKSRQNSLEYQFRSRLERLTEREKELEDKVSKNEEVLKQKEERLAADYQKKSEELRGRWASVEGELWQLRQEQLAKQQEFERVYGARLEEEKKRMAEEAAQQKNSLEESYRTRVEELEKRERTVSDELKKQEAVQKWARDSWQKEAEERDRALKVKDLEIDKKVLEKNQELEDFRVKVSLLEKQLKEFPEAVKRRDEDLNRYKDAISSLESVIRTLETEKKNLQADYETRLAKAGDAVDSERSRFREMESEIPKRLKIAVEHERNRFAEKLHDVERGYREDLGKRQEEVDYLQRNLRTFEETIKTLQAEREALVHKTEQMQTQYNVKLEEFSFREKQLQSEYDVRLKVEMEKTSASLRSELETAGRIYEDSLRLKVEEISHLRRDIEDLSKEKNAAKELQAELRRQLEATDERAAAGQDSLRAKLKAEQEQKLSEAAAHAERRHAAEKQKFADELGARAAEFQAETGRKDEAIAALRLSLQQAGEDQRMLRQKAGEELKAAVAEEKARSAAELEDRVGRLGATIKLREDKISELSGALENARLEKEELVLLERERLQRLYAEKERAMDEELAARDSELLRAREAAARASVEKDAAVQANAADRRGLEEKLAALNQRLADDEASAGVKLDAALRREADRFNEIIERKNKELDAAAHLRQSEEDAYRKTLADFRSSLSDALGKMEAVKALADERQAQLMALQVELAQEKKHAADQGASLAARLSDKEKLYRDLSVQHDDLKEAFEEEVKGAERRYNDALLRLRATEEQKASRDKQIEALKRDLELVRAENQRRDLEAAELKSSVAKQLEGERREMHIAGERRGHDYAQKEKALLAEISSLRDIANSKDVLLEKQKVQCDEARNSSGRLKAELDEERARRTEKDAALSGLKEDYEEQLDALAARDKALAAEVTALKKSLAAVSGEALENRGEAEHLRASLERLKAAFEEERRKRSEAEAASAGAKTAFEEKQEEAQRHASDVEALQNGLANLRKTFEEERRKRSEAEAASASARTALEEKREEAQRHASDVEALKHGLARLKKAFEDERSKRVECELLAQTAHSALREKQEEFLRSQKLLEQLKEKIRSWKNK